MGKMRLPNLNLEIFLFNLENPEGSKGETTWFRPSRSEMVTAPALLALKIPWTGAW